MKSNPENYATDIVDECLRRALRDGILLDRCPDFVAAVQNWKNMMTAKLCNIEAIIKAYEEDELIKRRLSVALNAFVRSDDFKRIIDEYVESVLDSLVAEGALKQSAASNGTYHYGWADPDRDEHR